MKPALIYVTNGGGYLGGEVARLLVQSGHHVRALAESPGEREAAGRSGAEVVSGDRRDTSSFADTLAGAEVALLVTRHNPDLADLESDFVRAAKTARVGRVVKISAFNASLKEQGAKLLHALSEESVRLSGMKWTFLRPQFFMQNVLWFADEIRSKGTISLPMGSGRVGMNDYRDVAAVAAKCLTEDGHEGRGYDLSGPELLSVQDIAERLSRAVGTTIRYNDVSPEDFRRQLEACGWSAWHADAMTRSYTGMSNGASAVLTDGVKRVLGREPTSFDEVAQDYAHFFK